MEQNNLKTTSRSKNVLYGALIAFFVMLAFMAFAVARLVMTAGDAAEAATAAVEPIGNRVRNLLVPATPVILPNPTTIIRQINDLARLETASYELEKIVTADSGQSGGLLDIFLGESLVFVAYGKIYAGVDMSKMTKDNIAVVDPETVMIYLPPAEIFSDIPVLDNDKSYIADRDTGLLTRADPALETQVRQVAEASIREAAEGSDILERADQNAQEYMQGFLEGLGFENVIFTQKLPTDVPPYEQPIPKGYYLLPTPTPEPTG